MNMNHPKNLKAIALDAIALSRKSIRCNDERKPILEARCDSRFLELAEFPDQNNVTRLFKVWLQQAIPVRGNL